MGDRGQVWQGRGRDRYVGMSQVWVARFLRTPQCPHSLRPGEPWPYPLCWPESVDWMVGQGLNCVDPGEIS